MADLKISQLNSIVTVVPATDVLPVVQGVTTLKITPNQILGAGGTATLASATITGDLTVRTNKLKVDATGVGIGTASPTSGTLTVQTHYLLFPDSQTKIGDNGFCNGAASDGNSQIQFFGGKSLFFNEGASNTKMTLNSTGLGIGVVPANNKLQVLGNIGLPNSCTASNETSGVFSIDVANLYAAAGAVWRQCSFLLVYSGVDQNLGNSTVLQTIVTLQGLSTWNTISKNDIVGTASVAVSNDTTTGARITVTVPTGNLGSAYVMLIGGMTSTRPSITINP